MRTTSKLTIGVLILTAGSWLATTQSEAQDSSRSAAPDAQFTSEGSERCLTCHAGESMTAVLDTPHGDATNPHTPFANYGCESCHGPGSWHISRARGGAGFPPLLGFHIEEATSDPDNIDTEAIAIMTQIGEPFEVVNIFDDESIRPALVEYSEWPTTPQLFIGGEFIGGSDTAMEMFESGELKQKVEQA